MALTDKLTNIADAIRGKTGKTDPLTLDQMATEIAGITGGGGGSASSDFMISSVLSVTPVFDDTWATAEFTLASAKTAPFTVPNPLGAVPTQILVFKKNIDRSNLGGLVGGYNAGNIIDDSNDNRTLILSDTAQNKSKIPNDMIRLVSPTVYNFMNEASGGKATADNIYIRAGADKDVLWTAGDYVIGVK